MQEPYLEVTFRRGKPLAAYYYLPLPNPHEAIAAGVWFGWAVN